MRTTLVLAAVAVALLSAIFLLRDLPPPERLVFAAGVRDGGYWRVAERYQEILARDGIDVELLETGGSLENLALLANRTADVGLLQGGIPAGDAGVEALATVFVEPVLPIARTDREIARNPALWRDLTIARGGEGSGARVVADKLLGALGVAPPVNRVVDLGGTEAAAALLAGEIDLAIFVAPISAAYLQPLFASPDTALIGFDHAEAISLRLPFSRVVSAPSGAISLDPVVPPRPLPMVAMRARLAAVPHLHPAVVDRLVLAAREIHGGNSIFAHHGDFPSAEGADLPIDAGAMKLLIEGQSGFHGWLPYWIAAQIRRVLLVVLPLFIVMVPLMRLLPAIYRWSMRRRIWRHYRAIGEIEMEIPGAGTPAEVAVLNARLEEIDHQLAAIRLPPPFRDGAYNARLHVELVRRQIADRMNDHVRQDGEGQGR
ncbi:TAXI family TRAP transporter solute-binding subunit [Tropicimonas aquimaris]|uniref:TAXI family TRAP transporter solute-binding subunit n=1 Tax=Tropicimonas aquimaris TaxID=914152 RepID=A0ABW3ILB2_9RHOB